MSKEPTSFGVNIYCDLESLPFHMYHENDICRHEITSCNGIREENMYQFYPGTKNVYRHQRIVNKRYLYLDIFDRDGDLKFRENYVDNVLHGARDVYESNKIIKREIYINGTKCLEMKSSEHPLHIGKILIMPFQTTF